jgi:tetratricopeptide (TPR) repeat protein/NADH:ubiquinone oxidoreductase subunit 3 (subunit A)
MAKHSKNSKQAPAPQPAPVQKQVINSWHITSFRLQAVVLVIVGLLFYANTFSNSYALDDNVVIVNNEYVQSGMSGIGKIMSGDALENFYKQANTGGKLAGGRYRPLSIVSFAIEQQLLGLNEHLGKADAAEQAAASYKMQSDMHVRHVVNVLLYILSVIVLLLYFRKTVFNDEDWAAFIAALIFLVLPVHTEVVANVKSRDEILSLLFITLTFITLHNYAANKKNRHVLLALVSFFFALLSKEYAIVLLVLLPLSLYFFSRITVLEAVKRTAIFLVPFGLYLLLRLSAVAGMSPGSAPDILNDPYMLATTAQTYASIFVVLLDYIRLLVWPHPLSADYSYHQLPYADLASPLFWAAVIVYAALMYAAIRLMSKRHITGWAIILYLVFLLPVSNLFINIGAPKGERFIFHASVGFAILFGWAMVKLHGLLSQSTGRWAVGGIVTVVVIASAAVVIPRNWDWRNDQALFLADVKKVPNSAVANEFAGAACLVLADSATDNNRKKELVLQAVGYINKAISIYPRYADAYINRGVAYLKLGDYEKAFNDCDSIVMHDPGNVHLAYLSFQVSDHFFNLAMDAYNKGNFDVAFPLFNKAAVAAPTDADLQYNVGFAYFDRRQYPEAKKFALKALSINPQHEKAKQLYSAIASATRQ